MTHKTRVTDDELWDRLKKCESLGTLGALGDFGTALIGEMQARTAALDGKATDLLGWCSAASAVLLAAWWQFDQLSNLGVLLLAGVATSSLGTLFAFLALRIRDFEVPSQAEWLQLDLVNSPCADERKREDDEQAIRRRHIQCLLRWHRYDGVQNGIKARWVKRAFVCLFLAGMVLPVAVLLTSLP